MVDGRGGAGQPQALLHDPDFPRTLVERTVQAILEAEMAAHLGAALGGPEVGLERRVAAMWRRAKWGGCGDCSGIDDRKEYSTHHTRVGNNWIVGMLPELASVRYSVRARLQTL